MVFDGGALEVIEQNHWALFTTIKHGVG